MGNKKVLVIFVFLSLLYAGLNFLLPESQASKDKFALSGAQLQLLKLSIVLPVIAIWMVAYYGYSRVSNYAHSVRESEEGKAWQYLSWGLLGLALWLPISSNLGQVFTYIHDQNADLVPSMVILRNYLNILLLAPIFYLLYKGARLLSGNIEKPLQSISKGYGGIALFISGGLFAYLTLTNPNKSSAIDAATPGSYYLPDWLLIITIIIPYIIIFFLGLRAVQEIYHYRINVKGTLYRDSLRLLADGIGLVALTVLLLRFMASLTHISNANLNTLMAIVYFLVFIIAAGYASIALGAKRLQRLEEV